jgi:hypothetical protein
MRSGFAEFDRYWVSLASVKRNWLPGIGLLAEAGRLTILSLPADECRARATQQLSATGDSTRLYGLITYHPDSDRASGLWVPLLVWPGDGGVVPGRVEGLGVLWAEGAGGGGNLLARQHLPNRRAAETMRDLYGLEIATGTIDVIYSDAARRLQGFIAALVALLRSLPVLHAVDHRPGRDPHLLDARGLHQHLHPDPRLRHPRLRRCPRGRSPGRLPGSGHPRPPGPVLETESQTRRVRPRICSETWPRWLSLRPRRPGPPGRNPAG